MAYRFHRWVLYLNQMNSWICVLFTRIAFNRERDREKKSFPINYINVSVVEAPHTQQPALIQPLFVRCPPPFFLFYFNSPSNFRPSAGGKLTDAQQYKTCSCFFFSVVKGDVFFHCFQLWMERNFYRITFFFILVFIRSRNNKNSFLFAVSWDGKSLKM